VKFTLRIAPWFGGGVAWGKVLDSQYARVVMETGLFGLAAFLFLQYRVLRTSREAFHWTKNWMGRGVALGASAATIGLIAHSLGTISFLIVRIMEPYWFLIALTVVVRAVVIEDHMRQVQAENRATPQGKNLLQPARAPATL
jgi:O-antigen ligase